ncbi:hypothetical protein HanOQP8_Chr09g0329851 [Helianthus annuus]|nr:hypothetical protein HanOQP8_Chr09g0329851 [Helianthus annuus]
MHHVVALIAERQKGTCTNRSECYVPYVQGLMQNYYRAGARGSHWKQPLYFYGVEVRLSTFYPPQTLPLLCYWWDLLSMMMMKYKFSK